MGQGTPVQLDSSDWWSYTRKEEFPVPRPSQPIRFQSREPAEANFRVAGITLGATWDFSEVRFKFGEATEAVRGDAASARKQICYKSSSDNVHLIFELGEVNAALYLFEDGPKWNGDELCAASEAVSAKSSTASGLRLGLEPQQVRAILGVPSMATPQKLIYCFGYRTKTSRKALAQLRRSYPEMSDAEFNKDFEDADGEAYIEAWFASGRLNYLAISRSESY
jgi:hypothetical protein